MGEEDFDPVMKALTLKIARVCHKPDEAASEAKEQKTLVRPFDKPAGNVSETLRRLRARYHNHPEFGKRGEISSHIQQKIAENEAREGERRRLEEIKPESTTGSPFIAA